MITRLFQVSDLARDILNPKCIRIRRKRLVVVLAAVDLSTHPTMLFDYYIIINRCRYINTLVRNVYSGTFKDINQHAAVKIKREIRKKQTNKPKDHF